MQYYKFKITVAHSVTTCTIMAPLYRNTKKGNPTDMSWIFAPWKNEHLTQCLLKCSSSVVGFFWGGWVARAQQNMSEYIILSHLRLPSPFHFGVTPGKVWCFILALVGQYLALFSLPGCLEENSIPSLVINSYWQHESLEQVRLALHLNDSQGKQRCLQMVCWVEVVWLFHFSFLKCILFKCWKHIFLPVSWIAVVTYYF